MLRWIAAMKRVFNVICGHQRHRRAPFKAKLVLGSMQGIGFCGIVCAAQACAARLQKPTGTGKRPVPAPKVWAFSFAKQSYPPRFATPSAVVAKEYSFQRARRTPVDDCCKPRLKPWHRCRLTWTQPTVQERAARTARTARGGFTKTLAAWQL